MGVKTKFGLSVILLMLLSGTLFACDPGYHDDGTGDCVSDSNGGNTGGGTGITMDSGAIAKALQSLCVDVKAMLGVAMMLMVVSSAVVYSVGQTMGAETRARASVWATSMFNGAIIAALMYIIVPWMLNEMLKE